MGTHYYIRGYRNDDDPAVHIGRKSFSEFTWVMSIDYLKTQLTNKDKPMLCPCCRQEYTNQEKVIEDEYGHLYTFDEFCEKVIGRKE